MSEDPASRRVLLVEDDDDLRLILGRLLEDAGFTVIEAENGRVALERLRDGAADAIILDLMMPDMNGWEFRLRQRKDPLLSNTPVLVISADTRPEARAVDADLFVKKPFAMRQLLDALDRVIVLGERRRSADQHARSDRMATIVTLAAGLAHEINNPLMGVLGSLELADRLCEKADPEPIGVRRHLQNARSAAQHIERLIRDVSSFASQQEAVELLDVRPILETALSMVVGAGAAPPRVESRHEPVPPVRASRGALLRVFVNLLDNAVRAVHATLEPCIRTRTRTTETGHAAIEIEDSGPGIPAEHRGRIFDPFFTTRAPGEGTGLGLSICHSTVRDLHGTIDVESSHGTGATFRVVLPAASSATLAAVDPPPKPASVSSSARVLIVDDEPLVRSVLERLLSAYDVSVVGDGASAIRSLQADHFDLLLCDLMLGDVSGLDVIEAATRLPPDRRPQCVLMTGSLLGAREKARLERAGAALLRKPFRTEALLGVVRRALDSSRAALG